MSVLNAASTRLKEVVALALERLAADRKSYPDAACDNDSQMRIEAASLPAAHAEAGRFPRPAMNFGRRDIP
jgi:hypothetical protein